jgi:II/X family phage/plasmid replication protein
LRLHKVYRLIIKDGFEATKRATDRATFMRQMRDFTAIGLSRAQLMQYTGQASNVVPLIRFINVDFAQQLPADWVEPLPLSQQIKKEGLRLVS